MLKLQATEKREPRPEDLRILIGAFLTGLTLFTGIALYLGPLGDDTSLAPVLGGVLVLLGLGELVAVTVLGKIQAAKPAAADSAANDRERIQEFVQARLLRAALASDFEHRGDRPTYYPARLIDSDPHARRLELVNWQGSGDLASLATAEALTIFPAGDQQYQPGDVVDALLL